LALFNDCHPRSVSSICGQYISAYCICTLYASPR
jgi:hypothetical protein